MEDFCGYRLINSDSHPVTGRVLYRKLDIGGFDVEVYNREDHYVVIYDMGRYYNNEKVAKDRIAEHLCAIELLLMVSRSAIPVNSGKVHYDDESGRFWFLSSDRGYRYVWDSMDKWYRIPPSMDVRSKLKGPSKTLDKWGIQALKELMKVYRKASEKSHSVEYGKVGLVVDGDLITFNNLEEVYEFLEITLAKV